VNPPSHFEIELLKQSLSVHEQLLAAPFDYVDDEWQQEHMSNARSRTWDMIKLLKSYLDGK